MNPIDWHQFVRHVDYYCRCALDGHVVIINRDDGEIVVSASIEEIYVDDDGPPGFSLEPRPSR